MKNFAGFGLFVVAFLFLGACAPRYVLMDGVSTIQKNQPSQEELVSARIAEEMARVKKIIDLDDPKLDSRVRAAYIKAHKELDELFVQAQICEAENLAALRHNVLSAKDCTPDAFRETPGHSNYGPALNPRTRRGSVDGIGDIGDINININTPGYDNCYVIPGGFSAGYLNCGGVAYLDGPRYFAPRYYRRHYRPRCDWAEGWFGIVWRCRG